MARLLACEKGLFLLFLAAAWFDVWWALPLLFFLCRLFGRSEFRSMGKAGNGYPEMEAGDAMGIGCLGFLSLVISLIWFSIQSSGHWSTQNEAIQTPIFGVFDDTMLVFFAAAALRCRTVFRRSGSLLSLCHIANK